MNQDIIILTTLPPECFEIERIIGPVTVVIAGAGSIFRDILSNFRDIFGGKSKTYSRAFSRVLDEGFKELKEKTRQMGANGVIGFRIESTNIPKAESMLIFFLYGTAVILRERRRF